MGRDPLGGVKVQVRISTEEARLLQEKSTKLGIPLTEYGGSVLARGLHLMEAESSEAVMLPLVRRAVRSECDRFLDRIMELLLRNYMEAGTARRLIEASMVFPAPQTREFVKQLENVNWDAAYEDFREDIKGVGDWRSLLTPVEDQGGT